MERKGNLLTLLCKCKFVQSLWKTVWRVLKKLRKEKRSKLNRYREQTSDCQSGERREAGQYRNRGLRGVNYYVQTKATGYII